MAYAMWLFRPREMDKVEESPIYWDERALNKIF
jgi:hypothetical protein